MTTPTPSSPELPAMDIQALTDRFTCQTPDCPTPVRIITIDLDDNTVEMECLGCLLARNLAIFQAMAAQGMLGDDMAQTTPTE
jgi:hypothetical protein